MAIHICSQCSVTMLEFFIWFVISGYVKGSANIIKGNDLYSLMDYGVVVDAGSSGSRVRVYTWAPRLELHHVPEMNEIFSHKMEPGISSYVHSLDNLEDYINHFVFEAAKHVPKEQQSNTPIYVFATAGMRLLLEHHANSVIKKIDSILQNKSSNPFQYKSKINTRILSGEEEGVFAWITTNYLRNFFNIPEQGSAGILEMGGASTQIAFTHSGSILADKFPVTIAGRIYPLYVHSYLTFGQDHLTVRVKESLYFQNTSLDIVSEPCMLKGDSINYTINGKTILFEGTGKPALCHGIIDSIVYKVQDEDHCYPKPCAIGSVYQPTIKNQTFYALAAFSFTLANIGAINKTDNSFSPGDTLEAAFQYCSMHIDEARIERKRRKGKDDNYRYYSTECMMGLYIPVLLVKGYGFSNTTRQLTAVKRIREQKIEWPLGALLYEIDRRDWTCVVPQALPSSGFFYNGVQISTLILSLIHLYVFSLT